MMGTYGSLNLTVGKTTLAVWACLCVPLVPIVAIFVAAFLVEPAPVGIDDDLTIDVRAAAAAFASASLPGHLWMSLRLLFSDELSRSSRSGQEGRNGPDGG